MVKINSIKALGSVWNSIPKALSSTPPIVVNELLHLVGVASSVSISKSHPLTYFNDLGSTKQENLLLISIQDSKLLDSSQSHRRLATVMILPLTK